MDSKYFIIGVFSFFDKNSGVLRIQLNFFGESFVRQGLKFVIAIVNEIAR